MNTMSSDSLVNIEFRLYWKSKEAVHSEVYYGQRVNYGWDIFPKTLHERLMSNSGSEVIEYDLESGDARHKYDSRKCFFIRNGQFDRAFRPDEVVEPRHGRFYPKGMLKDISGVYRQNMEPFRVVGSNDNQLRIDFNHPLSGKEARLTAAVQSVTKKASSTGGRATDWLETITNGPGMQGRIDGQPTDFFSGQPFSRQDNEEDGRFYATPRLVNHVDHTAIEQISKIYRGFLKPDTAVLDLMSSWTSHIPSGTSLGRLTGLGLNEEELQANRQLTDYVLHDLNINPKLPFGDNTYHTVLCTVSVEYLTRPFEVFEEINRILKPGGCFIVTFSDRWFPSKAVRIWREIHEFERIGLIIEYFLASGRYRDIETVSVRGLPRPPDDKYYGERRVADPVFCVAGAKVHN